MPGNGLETRAGKSVPFDVPDSLWRSVPESESVSVASPPRYHFSLDGSAFMVSMWRRVMTVVSTKTVI